MEFKARAQEIIESYTRSIMAGSKLNLESLITLHLQMAYKQGKKDQQAIYKVKGKLKVENTPA